MKHILGLFVVLVVLLGLVQAAEKEFVEEQLQKSDVVIFSKSYCPFCKNTKRVLTEAGYSYHVVELNEIPNGSAVQSYLATLTGQRTVPNVFIKGKHVGGNDKIVSLVKAGTIGNMLKDEL